jgi:hypothetical protein
MYQLVDILVAVVLESQMNRVSRALRDPTDMPRCAAARPDVLGRGDRS